MKIIKRIPLCLMITAVMFSAVIFASCGDPGEPVKVTVLDGEKSMTAEGSDTMTVKELLDNSQIPVDERDSVVPDRNVRWKDAGSHAILIKRYAKVKLITDKEQKEVELYGGTVKLAVSQAGYNIHNYTMDLDQDAYLKDGMEIHLTMRQDGLIQDGDKAYYYAGGTPQTGIVGSESDGFYYADDNGVIDLSYCGGINVNGADWNVINGVATKVVSESDATLYRALQEVAKCTDSSMSKEEKLKKSFDYIKTAYLEGVRHDPPYIEMDWPVIYANDLLVYGKGDCYSYGAAFAYFAKAIGYTEVYACNSGGHGWAEIDNKVYDPEWSIHHDDFTYFGLSYDEDTDVNYKRGLNGGAEWKRIKI